MLLFRIGGGSVDNPICVECDGPCVVCDRLE